MYGCDLLFTPEMAAKVLAEGRARGGGSCACDRNERCPLLPADLTLLFRPPAEPESA